MSIGICFDDGFSTDYNSSEYKIGRQDGYQDGYERGHLSGYNDGYSEGQFFGKEIGIKEFVEYLNNNAFELRHDMELIQKYAKKFINNRT